MENYLQNIKSQLEGFNIVKLREIASTYNVKNYFEMTKKELVEEIVHQMYILMH